jgi:hypothetical protein
MNGSPAVQSANGGAMAFTTTHCSMVLEAQGESPAAQRALEILCRTYWRPLYGFGPRRFRANVYVDLASNQGLAENEFCGATPSDWTEGRRHGSGTRSPQ